MNDDLGTIAVIEDAPAKSSNANIIAVGIGGAFLAIGLGVGYFFGNGRGVKKGQQQVKLKMVKDLNETKAMGEAIAENAKKEGVTVPNS